MRLFTDFSRQDAGTPTGWSIYGTGEVFIEENYLILDSPTDSNPAYATYDSAPSDPVQEMVARVKATSTFSDQIQLILKFDPTGSPPTFYNFELTGGEWAALEERVEGGANQEKALVERIWSADTWYWLRFRSDNTGIYGRVWGDNEDEPQTWLVSDGDSSRDVGEMGFFTRRGVGRLYVDRVGFGTGGDDAPTNRGTIPYTITTTLESGEVLVSEQRIYERGTTQKSQIAIRNRAPWARYGSGGFGDGGWGLDGYGAS